MNIRDRKLAPIWDKIQQGQRLTLADGLALYTTQDVIALGRMANEVQQAKSGDAVYFVLNQKIEHTNICVLSCKFCDFAAKKGDERAYEMTTEDVLAKLTPEIREVHITGGMPPDWPWERYLDLVRTIHHRLHRRGTPATPGGRPENHAGWRGGDIFGAGPETSLQPEDRRQRVVRCP
jgi:aminodeoxyfutalosine synthase